MKVQRNTLLRALLAVLVVAAVAAPTAFGSDLRSPDTLDAAKAGPPVPITDMRSPDTQEAAKAGPPVPITDMRSPDTQEAANGRQLSPRVEVVTVAAPSHFDWLDAGIGVAFGLGASLVAAGAFLVVQRRRRSAVLST
jgi:hypothetical protein